MDFFFEFCFYDGSYNEPASNGQKCLEILDFRTFFSKKKKETVRLFTGPDCSNWWTTTTNRNQILWNILALPMHFKLKYSSPEPVSHMIHAVNKFLEEYFTWQRTKYYLVPGQKQQI